MVKTSKNQTKTNTKSNAEQKEKKVSANEQSASDNDLSVYSDNCSGDSDYSEIMASM